MRKCAAALVSVLGLLPGAWAAQSPDLSDPEAFVMGLIRASVRQTSLTRKAMENYSFRETVEEFEHRRDGSLVSTGTRVNWNYFSSKYGTFRSVPLERDGRETTARERERHAREEEKRLDQHLRARERAKEKQEREEAKRKARAEREAAKSSAATGHAPPSVPLAERHETTSASPEAWDGEGESSDKRRRVDERKAREVADQYATPTEGLEDAAKASVSLGWVTLSAADIARHFAFTYEGEEEHEGEPVYIVRYRKRLDVEEPSPDLRKAVPPVEGRIWIARHGNAVVRMDMALMEGVRYNPKAGFNVKEAEFSLHAKKVDGKHWFESDMTYSVNVSYMKLFRVHKHGIIHRHDFKIFTVQTEEGAGVLIP